MRCVPISDAAIASSLSAAGAPVLRTSTLSRSSPPSGSADDGRARRESRGGCGRAGRRRRSRRRCRRRREIERRCTAARSGSVERSERRVSHSTASSQVSQDCEPAISSSTGSNPPSPTARSAARRCSCRKRTTHRHVRRRRRIQQQLCRQGVVLADAASARRPAARAPRTASATGSFRESPGTGREGSPRRAPRRRRRGPDPSRRSSGVSGGAASASSEVIASSNAEQCRVPTCRRPARRGCRGPGAPSRCWDSAAGSGRARPRPAGRSGPRGPTAPAGRRSRSAPARKSFR